MLEEDYFKNVSGCHLTFNVTVDEVQSSLVYFDNVRGWHICVYQSSSKDGW